MMEINLSAFRTFYIASSRDRIDDVRELSALLTGAGLRNAFAWPEHLEHRCSTAACGISDRAELARLELHAAGTAELFIGIARLGKGAHVELGVALGAALTGARRLKPRVILVGVDRADSVFYDAEDVEHFDDVTAIREWLRKRPEQSR